MTTLQLQQIFNINEVEEKKLKKRRGKFDENQLNLKPQNQIRQKIKGRNALVKIFTSLKMK